MKLKQMLSEPSNNDLLLKYETGLPSWTIVLAQYTSLYRPWQRKILRLITFFASIITVSIGFYDLYKHLPMFQKFLNAYLKGWVKWLNQTIALKVGLMIMYLQEPFTKWFTLLFGEGDWTLLQLVFFPLIYCIQVITSITTIIYDLLVPILALIYDTFTIGFSLIASILMLPFTLASLLISLFISLT
jgi:hypothetical protein